MELPKLDAENTPKFNVGDRVWVISWRRSQEASVVSISFELVGSGNGPILMHMGYRLDTFNSDRPGLDQHFYPYQVFTTQAEVEELVRWHEIKGVSHKQWKQAIGNRKDDPSLDECELARCCSNVSKMRDLLYKCENNKGLVERDVRLLKDLWVSHNSHFDVEKKPNLKKILVQLGVVQS